MDRSHLNVVVGCVMAVLCFSALLQLAAQAGGPERTWPQVALGGATLVAIVWILVRLYRDVRRLESGGRVEHAG